MKEIELLLLKNYRLTTAEILYHFPDHPSLLQSFLWQEYDLAPSFPTLKKFLDYWEHSIEGKLHSVMVESCEIIKPNDVSWQDVEFAIH